MKLQTVNAAFLLSLTFILASISSASIAEETKVRCVSVVISGSVSRQYWSDLSRGAADAAQSLGVKAYVRGPANDKDPISQKRIIKHSIETMKCSALVLAPADSSLNAVVDELKLKGIPTIYVDRDTGGNRAAAVTTDNYLAGKVAANKMYESIDNHNGNILVLRLEEGIESTNQRVLGFIHRAKELAMKVIKSPYTGTQIRQERGIIEEILAKQSNIIGIFSPNDTTTTATILAKENTQKESHFVHIGFDEDPFIHSKLNDQRIDGYIAQDPYLIGYTGVKLALDENSNMIKNDDIHIPVKFISAASK